MKALLRSVGLTSEQPPQRPSERTTESDETKPLQPTCDKSNFAYEPILHFMNLNWGEEQRAIAKHSFHKIPYQSYFSLKYFIDLNPKAKSQFNSQEFLQTFRSLRDLEPLAKKIPEILNDLIPEISYGYECFAVTLPMSIVPILATDQFQKLFIGSDSAIDCQINIDEPTLLQFRMRIIAMMILKSVYGVDIVYRSQEIIFETNRGSTQTKQYFKMLVDPRFFAAKLRENAKTLSQAQIEQVILHQDEPDILVKLLSPADYFLEGFLIINVHDVTSEENQNRLQRILIDSSRTYSESLVFEEVCDGLRGVLEVPSLEFEITFLFNDEYLKIKESHQGGIGCIFGDSVHLGTKHYGGSVYEKADQTNDFLALNWPLDFDETNAIDFDFSNSSRSSFFLCALKEAGNTIGYLQVNGNSTAELQRVNTFALRKILPLLAISVTKTIDGVRNDIERTIKSHCTAIHPSVEWRFLQAALNHRIYGVPVMESIRFDQVIPLFAVSDIRSSSTHRNAAVFEDLSSQLSEVESIISAAFQTSKFPILDELLSRVSRMRADVSKQMSAGTETTILNFLRDVVHPTLLLAKGLDAEIDRKMNDYNERLDPRHHCFSERRREFEQSVSLINQELSRNLVETQPSAQKSITHYFELHATDGVDHGIYVGQSLLSSGTFTLLHLENLRLWQLISVCNGARIAHRIKDTLPYPLEVTHLIVAHDNPITLIFDYEQRQFDIEGAYSVRYEIMKKRIDKATIKRDLESTNNSIHAGERITQPMQLAIIYTQELERANYIRYLEYLENRGFTEGPIEHFELEDLQGIAGLHAMRCRIKADEQ